METQRGFTLIELMVMINSKLLFNYVIKKRNVLILI